MKHLTETVILGEMAAIETSVTITTKGGISSTNGFRPQDAVSVPENPEPLHGVAQELKGTARMEATGEIDATPAPDGRFLATPTVIIGEDDRIRVGNPSAWPFRVHGHVEMTFPNGKRYIGSGTMVNRHHVLTAGHCVYSKEDGGWATSIVFFAAQNESNVPFGSASATRLLSVTAWTQDQNRDWDMGMLILDKDLGSQTGWFGIVTFAADSELRMKWVNVTGYPGDKGGRQMWTHADIVKSVTAERFFYDIDTMGGQSGSGVWSIFQGHQGEKVAGIHTTGSPSGNGATRISRAKFDRILSWFQEY